MGEGVHTLNKMKLISTFAALASASQYFGEREDGVQWSATATDTALAYQEDGHSIVAMQMGEGVHTEDGIGMHSLCYSDDSMSKLPTGYPKCKTVPVRYSNWSWDGTELTAKGSDDLGFYEVADGYVADGQTHFTKTWYEGVGKGLSAEISWTDVVPKENGLMYGNFVFTTNTGTSGSGRFAAVFVDNAQFSAGDEVNPLPEE